MALTLILGVWMLWLVPGLLSQGWMHGKLALVALLVIYHLRCGQLVRALAQGPTPTAIATIAFSMNCPCWRSSPLCYWWY